MKVVGSHGAECTFNESALSEEVSPKTFPQAHFLNNFAAPDFCLLLLSERRTSPRHDSSQLACKSQPSLGDWDSFHYLPPKTNEWFSMQKPTTWRCTVDGRNPAPVDMVNIPLFTSILVPSQVVVWDFWTINSISYFKKMVSSQPCSLSGGW